MKVDKLERATNHQIEKGKLPRGEWKGRERGRWAISQRVALEERRVEFGCCESRGKQSSVKINYQVSHEWSNNLHQTWPSVSPSLCTKRQRNLRLVLHSLRSTWVLGHCRTLALPGQYNSLLKHMQPRIPALSPWILASQRVNTRPRSLVALEGWEVENSLLILSFFSLTLNFSLSALSIDKPLCSFDFCLISL